MRALSRVNVQAMVEGDPRVYDLEVEDHDGYRVIAVDTMLLLVVAETPGAASGWEPLAHFAPDLDDPVTAAALAARQPRPLTIEEARALTVRWAWWLRYDATTRAWETEQPPHADLTPTERERLLAWVRDAMATAELSRNRDDWLPASTYLACVVGERLGLFEGARGARPHDDLMREAKDLCEAAGTSLAR